MPFMKYFCRKGYTRTIGPILSMAVVSSHPLAKQESVTLEELAAQPPGTFLQNPRIRGWTAVFSAGGSRKAASSFQ